MRRLLCSPVLELSSTWVPAAWARHAHRRLPINQVPPSGQQRSQPSCPPMVRAVATRASLLRTTDAAAAGVSGEVTVLPSGVVTIAPLVVEPSRRAVGVLQRVPVVSPGSEHLASAIKRASRLSYTAGIRNETDKERNKAARQMDTLMKELSVPLTRYLGRSGGAGGAAAFPDPDKLHPFELTLLQLTIGVSHYKSVLGKVNGLRKSVQETGKSYASRAAQAPNKSSALEAAAEGFQTIGAMFQAGIRHIDDLKDIGKKLRALPLVDTSLPTLALVGAPNVGKSSLVKVLSSGTPEVCNYPFTTRSIKMGHFYLDGRKHQVTDTPGVMNRPDGERNKMEMLTLAALDYLPTYIVFVTDLTEECGTSAADQWAIRADLRQRYAGRAWLDVFSKADMLGTVFQVAEETRRVVDASPGPHLAGQEVPSSSGATEEEAASGPLRGSSAGTGSSAETAVTNSGVGAAGVSSTGQSLGSTEAVVAAAAQRASIPASVLEWCLQVPNASRVSSVTNEGIGGMQQRIIDLLTQHGASEPNESTSS